MTTDNTIYNLIHYEFNGEANLYDIRLNAYKDNSDYKKPVKTADKLHYEIFEFVENGKDGEYIITYDKDCKNNMTFSTVDNWSLLEKDNLPTNPKDSNTKNKKFESDFPEILGQFPWFDIDKYLFTTYDNILQYSFRNTTEYYNIMLHKAKQFKADSNLITEIDNIYREKITKEYTEIINKYALDKDNIAEMLINYGTVDPLAYISHDLTYIYPIFEDNNRLKEFYKATVLFNTWYHVNTETFSGFVKKSEITNEKKDLKNYIIKSL